jgi:magnesium chelatase family protein
VLFLDELPEFPYSVLESIRQPLEDGTVTVSRAQETVTFPTNFMLVGPLRPVLDSPSMARPLMDVPPSL